MGPTIVIALPNMLALSSAVIVGFAVGRLMADWGKRETTPNSRSASTNNTTATRGAKRRARIRKSEDKSRARTDGLASPSSAETSQSNTNISRRTRNRKKKLAPGCLALDAWTRVARSYIKSIGAGDYESLLLLPRAAFIVAGRFTTHAECSEHLVSLGKAREATSGIEQLRMLYVNCSWASAGGGAGTDWASRDFETTRQFLQCNPDISFVYVGRSCVAGSSTGAARSTQLRHVVLALLRSDVVLVLPRQAKSRSGDGDCTSTAPPAVPEHAAFTDFTLGSWSRMELAVAAVGQAKVFVAFRAEPFPESVLELELGKGDVGAMTEQAVGVLKRDAGKSKKNAGVAAAACDNWLGADLNPLSSLEEARGLVAAALKSDDGEVLESIRSMRSIQTAEVTARVRASLGEEYVKGERELALSMLLFAVLCSQPKERATYTDGFVEDAAKMEISYRPIAVVRSPYRERWENF